MDETDPFTKAKNAVRNVVDRKYAGTGWEDEDYEVMVVWFSKTLQNWKALLTTSLPDQWYYEVTYNGQKSEMYVDVYQKIEYYLFLDEASSSL